MGNLIQTKRFLIIHTWGIGDWLFFSPVLKAIQDIFPQVEIDVILGTPHACDLVAFYPNVRVRAVTDVRKGFWGILFETFKTRKNQYDVLLFTAGVDSRKCDLLAFFVRAKQKVCLLTKQHHPWFLNLYDLYDNSLHVVENNLKFMQLLDMPSLNPAQIYFPFPPTITIPNSILIHPGSDKANAYKRWPADSFRVVADQFLQEGRVVSVILGPSESELAGEFERLQKYPYFKLFQNITFRESLDAVANHEIFLASDSGLGHIAAALGKEVFSIFGPTDPIRYRPYSGKAEIIQCSETLKCQPCNLTSKQKGCAQLRCLSGVTPEEVVRIIKESKAL